VAPSPRRLLRSRHDRVIGGVCSGLARYFNIDPLIIRIAAVALVFVGGFAIVAYIAALLLVPDDDGTGNPVPGKPGRIGTIAGAVLVVVAILALADGQLGWSWGWGVGAIGVTALIIGFCAIAGQRLLGGARDTPGPSVGRIAGVALIVGAVLVGSVVVAFAAALATAAGGGTPIAILVVVLGVAMVGLSLQGRQVRWLALRALVIAVPSGVVAAAGVDSSHGVGERRYKPATITDVKPRYELSVGELEVDLRRMRWPAAQPVRLTVDVGMGHALILVPRDTCVRADTHAGLGYVGVLGSESGGADVDDDQGTVDRTTSSKKLIIDAKMGIGAIEILHTDGRGRHGHYESIRDALADDGCAGDPA
jgi:phage shock protein PspC (stress-responsive transcriptional regulator)